MRWSRIIAGATGFAALLFNHSAVLADDVTIENDRGRKVKVCSYQSDDKSAFRPRKCWMLDQGQSVLWKRSEGASDFDLRVFGPGVFELPICMERRIGPVFRVTVSPVNAKTCVTTVLRNRVAKRQWDIDDRVIVNRDGDNFWYPAIVLKRAGNDYRLRLLNLTIVNAPDHYILADEIGQGSRVQSNWKRQGRWYSGTVLSREGETVMIKYDDGWTEAGSVRNLRFAPDDIAKLPQPEVN